MGRIKRELRASIRLSPFLLFVILFSAFIISRATAIPLFSPGLDKELEKESPEHQEAIQALKKNEFDKVVRLAGRRV